MGAWGTGAFDNDNAADFAGNVEDCSDDQARQDLLDATLGAVLDELGRLASEMNNEFEFPYEIEHAIAAAAFVADARNGRTDFTNTSYAQMHDREKDTWEQIPLGPPSEELVLRAIVTMSAVLAVMQDVAGVDEEWQQATKDILAALSK